jgi:carbon starvation protein
MYVFRKGKVTEATIIGVIGLLLAVYIGRGRVDSSWAAAFTLSPHKVTILMASWLHRLRYSVWLLLCPRLPFVLLKIGTIAVLIIGVILGAPESADAGGDAVCFRRRTGRTRQGLPVRLHHDLACGAISGFHALISSGTTPK